MKKGILVPLLVIANTALANPPEKLLNINEGIYSISAEGTKVSQVVMENNMLPRGSALITHSGDLRKNSINYIIHVASGAMSMTGKEFDPTLEGIKQGIKNGLILAAENEIKTVALPVIGGNIFLRRVGISKRQLAKEILMTLSESQSDIVKTVIIWNNPRERDLFEEVHQELGLTDNIKIIEGDIVKFSDHQSEAIMNAANMEVQFGRGVSGAIARAAGEASADQIDDDSFSDISLFNNMIQHRVEQIRNYYTPIYAKKGLEKVNEIKEVNSQIESKISETQKLITYEDIHQANLQNVYDESSWIAKIFNYFTDFHENMMLKSQIKEDALKSKVKKLQAKLKQDKSELDQVNAKIKSELKKKVTEVIEKLTITGSK